VATTTAAINIFCDIWNPQFRKSTPSDLIRYPAEPASPTAIDRSGLLQRPVFHFDVRRFQRCASIAAKDRRNHPVKLD